MMYVMKDRIHGALLGSAGKVYRNWVSTTVPASRGLS
jgi:hypothetical protein